jgi:hypothetical protein
MTSNKLYQVLCGALLLAWPLFVNADDSTFRLEGGMLLQLQTINPHRTVPTNYVSQGLESIPAIGKQEVLMSRRYGQLGDDHRIEYSLIAFADKTGSSEVTIDGQAQMGDKAWEYRAHARKENWQESVFVVIEALSRLPSASAMGAAVRMPKDLFARAGQGMASRTSIPVHVPVSIQSLDVEGVDGCATANLSRDSFSITLYGRLTGHGQTVPPPCEPNEAALLAGIRGDVKPMPDLSGHPSAQAVVLQNGARGWLLPVSCGASCAPATLHWQTTQASYSIQMKFDSLVPASRQQKELLDTANSVQVVQ